MKPPVKSNKASAKPWGQRNLRAKALPQEAKGDAQQLKGDAKNAVKDGVNKAADAAKGTLNEMEGSAIDPALSISTIRLFERLFEPLKGPYHPPSATHSPAPTRLD